MNQLRTIASFLPANIRALTYAVIGAAMLLEAIWGVIPEPIEAKLVTSLAVLGFGMATVNTVPKET